MFNRILVPLDGSKLAEQVLPHVTELARAFNPAVIIMEICEPGDSQYKRMCEIYIENQAAQLKKDLGETSTTVVKKAVLVGKPAPQIVSYAKKNSISIIIMASHGSSGIKPWSFGSTSEMVLNRAHVPIIILRSTEPSELSVKVSLFDTILTPLDGSERDEAALPYVKKLVGKFKSRVILLQVVTPGKHVQTVGGLDYIRYDEHDIDSMKARAQKYLEGASAKLAGATANIRYEVRVGEPPQEIIKCADELNCSLIAISTHGRSGIDRWLHGSTTHQVLQSSKHSLLLVPL